MECYLKKSKCCEEETGRAIRGRGEEIETVKILWIPAEVLVIHANEKGRHAAAMRIARNGASREIVGPFGPSCHGLP